MSTYVDGGETNMHNRFSDRQVNYTRKEVSIFFFWQVKEVIRVPKHSIVIYMYVNFHKHILLGLMQIL